MTPTPPKTTTTFTTTTSTVETDDDTSKRHSTDELPAFWNDPTIPWAIDMDGTLIREDVTEVALQEAFRNPRYWLIGILALLLYYMRLFRITAYRLLERLVPVDPASSLTYHQPLLQALQRHRQQGGIVILATATHVHAARAVANHVEEMLAAQQDEKTMTASPFWFDDVIGSQPPDVWDASAHVKANLIHARFPKGFVYAGNSTDDLQVWQHAACRAMILVNCPPHVVEQAKQLCPHKPLVILD